ncbi:uncharacterized protein LOC133818819 [Humulus lupulus]|uniref:uncharacterized protein LOC133818819 n=1 Tax=Humulus lupulus TaxID=3486 RepID=UPI002B410CC6|nr:uncharacterized protein LOC133818819 [Humulus lupulus]
MYMCVYVYIHIYIIVLFQVHEEIFSLVSRFHLPIAYHGRASSVVISGMDIIRPRFMTKKIFTSRQLIKDICIVTFRYLVAIETKKILEMEGVRNPLPPSLHNFYVLIETTGSSESSDKEKLEAFLIHAMEVGFVSDVALAKDINQALSFWCLREKFGNKITTERLQDVPLRYQFCFYLMIAWFCLILENELLFSYNVDEVHGWHPSLALAPEVEEESLELFVHFNSEFSVFG